MKFLEQPRLAMLSAFLGSRELGDRVIHGRIEAFSCKRAGDDKKLARDLEQQYVEEMAASSGSSAGQPGTSPLGPLSDAATRRLLIDLISTMNASFPDHDFSALTADQFVREPTAALVCGRVNRHLAEARARAPRAPRLGPSCGAGRASGMTLRPSLSLRWARRTTRRSSTSCGARSRT